MPRVAIPVVDVNLRGGVIIGATSPSPVEINGDVGNGHSISGNDGRVVLHARNSAAGTITLNVGSPQAPAGFVFPNRTITRINVGDLIIGPFPVSMFSDTVLMTVDSANWRLRAYRLGGPPNRSPVPPVSPAAGSRVNLPLTAVTRSGIDITAGIGEVTGDAANDHYFANDGNVLILARATSVDVTYNPVAAFTMDGQAVADFVAPVAIAAPIEIAGPYPPAIYNQPDGNVYMNVASNTIRLRALWLPFQE